MFSFFPFSANFFSLLSDDAVKILADDLESVIGLFPVSIMWNGDENRFFVDFPSQLLYNF